MLRNVVRPLAGSLARQAAIRPLICGPSRASTYRNLSTSSPLSTAAEGGEGVASTRIFPPSETAKAIAALKDQGFDTATLWEQRVIWGDADAFQHVNNVNYVKWFESARMFYVETLASSPEVGEERKQEIVKGTGKSIILARIDVRYRRPVTYPDTIIIGTGAVLPLEKDRVNLRGVAYSVKQQTVVAIANQDCVSYDYQTLKKCDFPQDIKAALEKTGVKP